jgi:hypothetical protein
VVDVPAAEAVVDVPAAEAVVDVPAAAVLIVDAVRDRAGNARVRFPFSHLGS